MISVGIDVSKEKSTVCILKPYGEIVRKPFDIYHTQTELTRLSTIIRDLDEEVRVVMEATGVYHLPILTFLKDEGFFVAITNPLEMKRYRCQRIRSAKTDRIDSKIIANYGLYFWFHLKEFQSDEDCYYEFQFVEQLEKLEFS